MPSTLTMSTAGVLSGTPVNADVGVHTIVVTATDDASTAGSVTDTFELTVVNTNDPTEGSSALVGDGSPWTESSSLTATVSGSTGTEVSFTITSLQRAVISFSFDNYPSECGVIIDGTATSCTGTTLTTACLLYTSPSPRDRQKSRMPSSA